MSYVIRYATRSPQEACRGPAKSAWSVRLSAAVVVASVVIRLLIPESGAFFRRLLIPGMPDSAAESFSEMMTNLRGGMEIAQAVDAFCQDVLDDAVS